MASLVCEVESLVEGLHLRSHENVELGVQRMEPVVLRMFEMPITVTNQYCECIRQSRNTQDTSQAVYDFVKAVNVHIAQEPVHIRLSSQGVRVSRSVGRTPSQDDSSKRLKLVLYRRFYNCNDCFVAVHYGILNPDEDAALSLWELPVEEENIKPTPGTKENGKEVAAPAEDAAAPAEDAAAPAEDATATTKQVAVSVEETACCCVSAYKPSSYAWDAQKSLEHERNYRRKFEKENPDWNRIKPVGRLLYKNGQGFVLVLGKCDEISAVIQKRTWSKASKAEDFGFKWQWDGTSSKKPTTLKEWAPNYVVYEDDEFDELRATDENAEHLLPLPLVSVLNILENKTKLGEGYVSSAFAELVHNTHKVSQINLKAGGLYVDRKVGFMYRDLFQYFLGKDLTSIYILFQMTEYKEGYHIDIPGGKRNLGESCQECGVRECKEETGIDLQAQGYAVMEGPQDNKHRWIFALSPEVHPMLKAPMESPMMLTCCERDCGMGFEYSKSEQAYYTKRGWKAPIRCKKCLAKRKKSGQTNRQQPYRGQKGGGSFRP